MSAERHDIVVVGGGLAGLMAARRARRLGARVVVLAATPGSLPHTSGALDLLAVYPTETKHFRSNPWEALADLIDGEPDHPYAVVGLRALREAWEELAGYLERGRLRYRRRRDENLLIVTAAGTLKPTYLVPGTMSANVDAWESKAPTLVVGFERHADFAPELVARNLSPRWPGIRATRLDPHQLIEQPRRIGSTGLGALFERPEFREGVAEQLRPRLGNAAFVGFPAVLGFDGALAALDHLEQLLGVRVFEIPLLSPSLPGMRLGDLLKQDLLEMGVDCRQGRAVVRLERAGGRIRAAVRQGTERSELFEGDSFILATGRFFGEGLVAERGAIREPLLDLPVEAPRRRDDWHMSTFLGAPGHPINRVGVQTDRELRPAAAGAALFDNLRAAGALLAHQDWVREKSGAGVAVVTGYRAAELSLGNGAPRGARGAS